MNKLDDIEAGTVGDGYGGVLILRNAKTGLLEYQRTPSTFKGLNALKTGEAAWEPTLRFRVLGWSLVGTANTTCELKDEATGTGIIIPIVKEVAVTSPANFANGYLSAKAKNKLVLTIGSGTVSGFIFGGEE